MNSQPTDQEITSMEQALELLDRAGLVGVADYINTEIFVGQTDGQAQAEQRTSYSQTEFMDAVYHFLGGYYPESLTVEQQKQKSEICGLFYSFSRRFFPSDRKPGLAYCIWSEDEAQGGWDAACGGKWQFISGNPAENGLKFCPHCGGVVHVKGKQ